MKTDRLYTMDQIRKGDIAVRCDDAYQLLKLTGIRRFNVENYFPVKFHYLTNEGKFVRYFYEETRQPDGITVIPFESVLFDCPCPDDKRTAIIGKDHTDFVNQVDAHQEKQESLYRTLTKFKIHG